MMEDKKDSTNPELLKSNDRGARSRLLEVAGIVFSEKGFERATAKEICGRAGANTAAVNYYFGGKEQLYVEVLREAHGRLVNFGLLKVLAEDAHVSQKDLEGFFVRIVHTILDDSPHSWAAKIMMREMTSRTEAFAELLKLQIRPTERLFRSVVSRFMGLPMDHEAVIRGTLCMVAQFFFILQNREVVELVSPELDLKGEGIDRMARHIWRFTTAGLRVIASEAKKQKEEG
ncbi:MAG: putative HTH-type transcriptional regulator YttP [Syntrophorhabdaceae bacterium PtaU1.Bin034]|nr:MAG: putative HTH-type transcriptional regulator YttP [Syntrophorhabdaceae bacterium PtaU1.Bin034]